MKTPRPRQGLALCPRALTSREETRDCNCTQPTLIYGLLVWGHVSTFIVEGLTSPS
jgi:hypothetical protein